jgi:hypothetical protein
MARELTPEQIAIAQEQLSEWLAYPTELEARPDEVELVGSSLMQMEEGPADLLVFRFRTEEPHWAASRGWMIGVAGPYLRSKQPTRHGGTHTFSTLNREDEKPLADHIEDLTRMVARVIDGPGDR